MSDDLYRKQIVRWVDRDGRRCKPSTPGASRRAELSRKWYATVGAKAVALSSDKAAARKMLNQLRAKADMASVGLVDPFLEYNKRPLNEHLLDYRTELEARGNDPRYVEQVFSRLDALFRGCEFFSIPDIQASRAVDWLAGLRRAARAPVELPPGQEAFTRSEAARLLGMSRTAFRDAVKRLGLPASGKGPARRYPRATVRSVADRQGKGSSVQTTNYYLSHLKSFCRWLVMDRRMGSSPVSHLEANSVEVDRRHDRRELTVDELRRLLQTTRGSKRTFRGLAGEDRFVLYAVACGTGFRASALASLTPAHFDLDSPTPTVALAARNNKSRKARVQPLAGELVGIMRGYLDGKPADILLWGGDWPAKGDGAEMLRGDLCDAGIPYVIEGTHGPLHADFHALRHSYITALGRSGVDLRTAQELAGHSTPVLTARYMHVRLHDLAGAVDKLPEFLPYEGDDSDAKAVPLRGTGTDGGNLGCSMVARTTARSVHPEAAPGKARCEIGKGVALPQPLSVPSLGTPCHPQASGDIEEAPPGFEPGLADLQSAALPLG